MANNVVTGGVAAIINRLRMSHDNPVYTLSGMEAHGKRKDGTSQSRQISDKQPLVYGSLDLQDAFESHVDGCRFSTRVVAPVLHTLLHWPNDMPLDEAGEQLMLARSVEFMQKILGGDAVFAARLDRDEAGRHTVDLFCTPKYMKKTKQGEQLWVSTSKHLKALCQKHLPEILARHPKIKNPDSLRCQGIAINSEFHDFVTSLGMTPRRKLEKSHSVPDRVSPETYAKAAEARKTIEAARIAGIEIKTQQEALQEVQEALLVRESAVEAREASMNALPALVREAAALLSGDETPARMLERHADERASSDSSSRWEDDWITNGRGEKFTPTYWQKLREHVVEFWREKIKQFGLRPELER